jgi:hypothetical protein
MKMINGSCNFYVYTFNLSRLSLWTHCGRMKHTIVCFTQSQVKYIHIYITIMLCTESQAFYIETTKAHKFMVKQKSMRMIVYHGNPSASIK